MYINREDMQEMYIELCTICVVTSIRDRYIELYTNMNVVVGHIPILSNHRLLT